MFTAALFTTALDMEATLNVHDRGMDKENVVHTYDGILVSRKREWDAICSNTDAPRDYYTTWSKSDKYIWYHLYVGSKKMINKLICNTETDSQTFKTNIITKGKRRKGVIH